MDLSTGRDTSFIRYFLTALLTVCAETALAWALAVFYHPSAVAPDYAALFVVPAYMFRPEPLERLQYLSCLFALPFFLYGFYLLISRVMRNVVITDETQKRAVYAASALGALLFIGAGTADFYFLRHSLFYTFGGVILFAAFWFWLFKAGEKALENKSLKLASAAVFIVSLALACTGFIFGAGILDGGSQYGMHFGAVFNSVAEVFSGKFLLVDIINQYGLYPFFLNPLFKLTGLSVISFTLLMAALAGAVYILFYAFARGLCRHKTTALLAVGVLLFLQVWHQRLVIDEIYFQTVPLRLIMPAAGLFAAWLAFAKGGRAWRIAAALICAGAAFWNFDTGAPLFIAYMAALVYADWCGGFANALKKLPLRLGLGLGALLVVYGIFALGTFAASGAWPSFGKSFAYAGYFYGYGFNMLPMSAVHGWNIVAGIYLLALCLGIAGAVDGKRSPRRNMCVMLALFGLGIFAYFQGRSADANLLFVCYPAVLLTAFFAERLLELPSAISRAWGGFALSVIGIYSFSFVPAAPLAAVFATERLPSARETQGTFPARAAFIRDHADKGEQPLILSYNGAVYHLYSGTKNPLNVPGFAELYLTADVDKITDYIAGGKSEKVFVEEGVLSMHTAYCRKIIQAVNSGYKPAAKSADGGMTLYLRRMP